MKFTDVPEGQRKLYAWTLLFYLFAGFLVVRLLMGILPSVPHLDDLPAKWAETVVFITGLLVVGNAVEHFAGNKKNG